MPAPSLPDPQTLAGLVSNVTETMCGIAFEPGDAATVDPSLCWKLASLSLDGGGKISVAISSNEESCIALGAALFACPPAELDAAMIDDSLRELLNMAAGQIKSALSLDYALGLPRIIAEPELSLKSIQALRDGVVLRSRGPVSLLIWITLA